MAQTTDDYVQEFVHDGLTPAEAEEMFQNYIVDDAFRLTPAEYLFNTAFQLDGEQFNLEQFIEEHNNREYNVGCDFQGVKSIKRHSDDDIFIPESYYCSLSCYEEYVKLKYKADIVIPRNGLSPYGLTLVKTREVIKQLNCNCEKKHNIKCKNHDSCKCKKEHIKECGIKGFSLPWFVKFNRTDTGKITIIPIDKRGQRDPNFSILLVPFGKSFYHAVLLKKDYKKYKPIDILSKIIFEKNANLVCEFTRLKMPALKPFSNIVYSYDIETYTITVNNKDKLIPYALAFSKVDLKNKQYTPPIVFEIDTEDNNNIYDRMFEKIADMEKDSDEDIIIYAHNGSGFDNIYTKYYCKNGKFIDQILVGSRLKSVTINHSDKTFILRDSIAFTLGSLKNSCKYFGAEEDKMDFDIIGWSFRNYKENRTWIPYLEQDVKSLSSLLIKVEELMNDMGESITINIGLPSAAWRIMCKNCFGLSKQYVPKHPSMVQLIKSSIYGGRVLHWKKSIDVTKGDEEYICMDANSLYPSAMYSSSFPIGEPKLIEKCNLKAQKLKQYAHFIITVRMKAPNIKFAYHPYKSEEGTLLYKAGEFVGTYNDVDYYEMVKDNYETVEIINGIYWSRSAVIFKELISYIYEMRKVVGGDSPKGYFYKIFLNSMYGKLLETIKSKTDFKRKKDTDRYTQYNLPNGQIETRTPLDHPIVRKPTQLASYVLSYSRKIMNEIIRTVGPENIAYSDTDSIYIAKSSYEKIKHGEGRDLCQYKNDYGDGKWITKAIFLDIKRYYLEFNSGETKPKIKFNGLNFKDSTRISNSLYYVTQDNAFEKIFEKLYKTYDILYENDQIKPIVKVVQEKFARLKEGVVISYPDLQFQIDPSKRGQWVNGEFYSLGYNFTENEYKPIKKDNIGDHKKMNINNHSFSYQLSVEKDRSLSMESGRILNYKVDIPISCNYFKSSFIRFKGKPYFVVDAIIKRGEEEIATKQYYDYGAFGPSRLTNDLIIETEQDKIEYLVAIKEEIGYKIILTDKEIETICRGIEKAKPAQ